MLRALRTLLLVIGIAGALLFGGAFALSFAEPASIEKFARNLIRLQVEQHTRQKIEALDEKFLAGKAGAFVQRHADEIESAKRQLRARIPEKVAAVIADMGNLDCECRRNIEHGLKEGLGSRILGATIANERLTALIRGKYLETTARLTREFRIFTGSNALVFALLALAVWIRPKADVHLLPAAGVLLVAAGVTAGLYLFNQDWLHTIVFSDYLGFGYVGYLVVAFAFLCDVMFNRARVTVRLLNQMLSALGSLTSVLPC